MKKKETNKQSNQRLKDQNQSSEKNHSCTMPIAETQTNLSDQSSGEKKVKQAHFVLQGKGGVGKSFIASLTAQYLRSRDEPVVVIDTDPVNATLAGYKAFDVQRLELMKDGSLIERNFDALIERIVKEDTNFVVDNGAASFIPLSYYIGENDAIRVIGNHGKQVVIHTVITGGQAMRDTFAGFTSLVRQMPEEARIIVWLNEFFGEIEAEGKVFEEMKVYQNNQDRVHGIIRIARQTSSTFGKDIQLMLDSKLTFDEINKSEDFGLMSKSRLFRVREALFGQLGEVV